MYQALYRKYRPNDFDSVVGQDSIIKTLKNSIINHNFSHAYMFFGPRGTGKTTVSKIFARNINCLNPVEGIACQKCDHCKASFSRDCVDIIEIDAASNNGVDEIRELKNKISLVPSSLTYKVYIIDEVHMLSIGAFNALLKTLEEPPEHAVFILATTDPQKVPETIVSRCQCFSFKRISSDVIVERLKTVCKSEKIKIEDEVIQNIALFSEGGLRDALGMLDKLTSYTDSKITMDDFNEVNGTISNEQIHDFLLAVFNKNVSEVLNQISLFDQNGKNLLQILTQILNYCRNLLVNYYLKRSKCDFSIDSLHEFTNLLNEKMFDIRKSSNTRIYMEMFVLNYIHNSNAIESSETVDIKENEKVIEKKKQPVKEEEKPVIKEVKSTEETSENDDEEFDFDKEYSDESDDFSPNLNQIVISSEPRVLNMDEIMKVRINNTLAKADKKILGEENSNFEKLKDFTFDQEIGYLVCSLLDSKVRVASESSIIISFEYDSVVKQNLLHLDKLEDVYHKITNSDKKFAIVTDEEWEKIKNEYIDHLKNKISYEIMEEPEVVLEEIDNNDIILSSAMDLFGDIVEVE